MSEAGTRKLHVEPASTKTPPAAFLLPGSNFPRLHRRSSISPWYNIIGIKYTISDVEPGWVFAAVNRLRQQLTSVSTS